MGKYQANFTLCRLAAIAFSKHLWQCSNVKLDLQSCIDGDSEAEVVMPPALKIEMKDVMVPEAAKEELMFAIGSMGREMLQLFDRLGQDSDCMAPEDSLFMYEASACVHFVDWTTDGCLNTPETMRSLYSIGLLRKSFATFEKLCAYCLEDCIEDLLSRISMSGYSAWRNRRPIMYGDSEFHGILTAYWVARVRNDLENAIDVVFRQLPDQFYDEAFSLDENMFMNSVVHRQYWAVKYFWGSLNENQRMRTIVKICERIRSADATTQKYKDLFVSTGGRTDHTLVFFLQQLSNYGLDNMRIGILGSGFVLLELLEWPYDNLFMETLKESLIHHKSIDYGPIISYIFDNISECKEFQFIDRDVKYRRIFWRIWEMNPQNLKESIDYPKCLTTLVQSGNVDLLDYILKDRELIDRREEFLKEIVGLYICDEADENFLPDFMMIALASDEEREWFRLQIDLAVKKQNEEMEED